MANVGKVLFILVTGVGGVDTGGEGVENDAL